MKKIKNSDLWSLDNTLAELILPYLVAFKKYDRCGYPSNLKSFKEWNKILDQMILSMKLIKEDSSDNYLKNQERIEEGLELFGKHFQGLWD